MKIIWLGHGSFRFEIAGKVLLLDPWLTGNPMLSEDQHDPATKGATHILLTHGHFDHVVDVLDLARKLDVPVIGLGASAATYYPAVGKRLGAEMILPEHAGVANAIGAVVGRVTVRRSGTVTSPSEGRFRVHLETGPEDFGASDAALLRLETVLCAAAEGAAREAGAVDIQVVVERDVRTAQAEAREVFVEAVLTVEASGRPRVAVG